MDDLAPSSTVNGAYLQANPQQSFITGASLPPPLPQSPSSTTATRPRDVRLVELLLTSAGVTSYEPRVPLMLLDFAYRHTSSILNDALHLSADPYTTHTGARPSGAVGMATASTVGMGGDATVSANAVRLAISARLNFQFRGGAGAGSISKEWMQDIARERNRVTLPKVPPNEWGVRLPSERFVLSGSSWGLLDEWVEVDAADDVDEDEFSVEDNAAMQDHDMGGVDDPVIATGNVDMDMEGDNDIDPGSMADVFGEEAEDEMIEE